MPRTVYEALSSNERMNEAAKDIQFVLKSKKLTISEAIIVLDIIKHNWMHSLIKTDSSETKVLFDYIGDEKNGIKSEETEDK